MEEYCAITDSNEWMYNPPVNINAYNPTTTNTTSAVRVVKEADWKRKIIALEIFNGVCAGAKDLIIYGVGEYAFAAIKHRYIGYRGVTPNKNDATHP